MANLALQPDPGDTTFDSLQKLNQLSFDVLATPDPSLAPDATDFVHASLQKINSLWYQYVGATPGGGIYTSNIVLQASAIPVTSGVALDITTLSLGAGKWICGGEAWLRVTNGSPNVQLIAGSIGLVSTPTITNPSDQLALHTEEPQQTFLSASVAGHVLPIVGPYFDFATPTTIYLSATVTWTGGGAISAYGKIFARSA